MSTVFYIEDACGEKFLFTIADASYEAAFRKHASWWKSHMKRPRHDHNGKLIRSPVYPCKIVVENQAAR